MPAVRQKRSKLAPSSNPRKHIKKYREEKRERFLSAAELRSVGQVLDEMETAGLEIPSAIAAVRLLILTGCRLNEISDAEVELRRPTRRNTEPAELEKPAPRSFISASRPWDTPSSVRLSPGRRRHTGMNTGPPSATCSDLCRQTAGGHRCA
jgi:hypothetical protein